MDLKPLKGHGAFDAVLKQGIRFTVGPVGLTVLVNHDIPKTYIVCGVAIGKRAAPLAVTRSRVRRLLRVATQKAARELTSGISQSGIHTMVMIWRRPVSHPRSISLADVENPVRRVMELAIHEIAIRERKR